MTAPIKWFFFVILLVGTTSIARADHALLTDGDILYNVYVPDGATTNGQLVRLRTTPASFRFDPRTNVISALPNFSVTERVADYTRSNQTVGRAQAVDLFHKRHWNTFQYQPPAQPRLVMPTPAPKQTPAPVVAAAGKTPVPLNVIPDNIPLEQRLDKQLQVFMAEQTALSQDAATSQVQGTATAEQAKEKKLQLLEQQQGILQRFFPATADSVRVSVNYWGQQIDRVRQTGRFDLENL